MPRKPRKIELLAPAKNAETGRQAILHGADAVYIGGPRFGARAAAGNSVDEIASLCRFAHLYGAKIYVTLNTILSDSELVEAVRLTHLLYEAGADALIVQDLGLLRSDLPPIALHASTQLDTRTPEKARFLADVGFSQVVLARELPLESIAAVHRATPVPLEVFVHGALCVSYSGQCYASAYLFGRSANRGECAQFCRLAFDLEAADGTLIEHGRHLLSLKDMNRSSHLESLLDAGVSSLKIEGRLKDEGYVKNVTAHYRRELDALFARRPDDYCRASAGSSAIPFSPQPEKSFNRGFTHYHLLDDAPADYSQPATPKAVGQPVGRVKEVRGKCFTVAGVESFHNGDGLCFFDARGALNGFRVNRAEGNCLYPALMPAGLTKHTVLFRNHDSAFEQELAHAGTTRKIDTDLTLAETPDGFSLTLTDERGISASLQVKNEKQPAQKPQAENLQRQLGKMGNTPFRLRTLSTGGCEKFFIPSSLLALWRRSLADLLSEAIVERERPTAVQRKEKPVLWPEKHLTYLANAANEKARAFWRDHGVDTVDPAFEQEQPAHPVLMFCRHCLRFAQGCCPKQGKHRDTWPQPWRLRLPDGKSFDLEFDCKHCQMKVHAPR